MDNSIYMIIFCLQKKVIKRKKADADAVDDAGKKTRKSTTHFQSVISTTTFSEVGGNEKSLKVKI